MISLRMCCKKAVEKIYISFLIKKKLRDIENYHDSGGATVIWTRDKVYKIENIGTSCLDDWENRRKIFYNGYPAGDAQLVRKRPFVICMERLEKKDVKNEDALKLLRVLKSRGKLVQRSYETYKGIIMGLEALEYYETDLASKLKVIDRIRQVCHKPIRAGVVHGDFHQGNILYGGG